MKKRLFTLAAAVAVLALPSSVASASVRHHHYHYHLLVQASSTGSGADASTETTIQNSSMTGKAQSIPIEIRVTAHPSQTGVLQWSTDCTGQAGPEISKSWQVNERFPWFTKTRLHIPPIIDFYSDSSSQCYVSADAVLNGTGTVVVAILDRQEG